jgi:hypothetical protein
VNEERVRKYNFTINKFYGTVKVESQFVKYRFVGPMSSQLWYHCLSLMLMFCFDGNGKQKIQINK